MEKIQTKRNALKNRELNDYNNSIPGRKVLKAANSLLTIRPYYQDGLWVFDDARVGLVAEPFVSGADDFIDFLLKKKRMRKQAVANGFTAIFSKQEFRGADAQLQFCSFASGGSVYKPVNLPRFKNKSGTAEVWLCPALNLYFKDSPEGIWAEFRK